MKTNPTSGGEIYFVTLGCSKNIVDSENIMGVLSSKGFHVLHEQGKAEGKIVIINTCGFIEEAKKESVDAILTFADARKSGAIAKLYVIGCLVQRYKKELSEEIPEVDEWFGATAYSSLIRSLCGDYTKELLGERMLSTPSHYAYLKISEGCNRSCSFCAIPGIRGKHQSIPKEKILMQAKKLASMGVKELILVAQDLTYYGLDLYKHRALAGLLHALADIDQIQWIRLHYAFPEAFPKDVLHAIDTNSKICRYIDIPLQHISNRILKSMRRGVDRKKIDALIAAIRNTENKIALRTTLITGYPGETEEEFEELLNWVRQTRFDRLGVFTYSHEEGTPAYALKDDVPESVKKKRYDLIMREQEHISEELNLKFTGDVMQVLIDRKENDYWVGRTEFDSPEIDNEVIVRSTGTEIRAGHFIRAKILQADSYTLYAEPC